MLQFCENIGQCFREFSSLDWWQLISATLALTLSFIPSFFKFRNLQNKLTNWGKLCAILMLILIFIAVSTTVKKVALDNRAQKSASDRSNNLIEAAITNIKRSDVILSRLELSLTMQTSLINSTNRLIENFRIEKGLKNENDIQSFQTTVNLIQSKVGIEGMMIEGNYYNFQSKGDSVEAVQKLSSFTADIINLLRSQVGNPVLRQNKRIEVLWSYYLNEMIELNSIWSGYGMTTIKEIANKIARRSRRFLLWYSQILDSSPPGSGLQFDTDEAILKKQLEIIDGKNTL